MSRQIIGVFGGTFDPVHFGHLRTAIELQQMYSIDQIHFVPCKKPVHRNGSIADAKYRLEMLKIAIKNIEGLVVDDREITRNTPSFMVPTLESYRNDYPNDSLSLIIAIDSFNTLDKWHQWERIPILANIIIIQRPGYEIETDCIFYKKFKNLITTRFDDIAKSESGNIFTVDTTPIKISSTQIREDFHNNRKPHFLLPKDVLTYISKNKLY